MATAQTDLGIDGTLAILLANNPIVEPLDGPTAIKQLVQSYFPDTLYNTGSDTRLFKLLTAMAGDSGAGALKKMTLASRLKNEGPLLVWHDLDTYYANIFRFPRLPSEMYNYDPASMALEKQVWDKITAADQSYRRRVLDFFHGTRFGNSPLGIALVAKAGSGEDVDVVENYRYIFDQASDSPLGLQKIGDSSSCSEFVLQPRVINNINSQSDILTITSTSSNHIGTYTITYADVPSSPVPLLATAEQVENAINSIGGDGDSAIIQPGDVAVVQVDDNDYKLTINNPQLSPFFFSVYEDGLMIDNGNRISITYPLRDTFYVARFRGPNTAWYEEHLASLEDGTFVDSADARLGNFTQNTTIYFDPAIERNMVEMLDHVRPIGALMTIKPNTERLIDVSVNKVFASSENFHISRFVTGNPNVQWPETDPSLGYFIGGSIFTSQPGAAGSSAVVEESVESEATYFAYATSAIPVIFHTIDSVFAYRDDALLILSMVRPQFYTDSYLFFRSEHSGIFSEAVNLTWYNFLKQIRPTDIFPAVLALAAQASPLVMTSQVIT
jgi:hypothetical protein